MEIVQLSLREAVDKYPECKKLSYGAGGGMGSVFRCAPERTFRQIQAFVGLRDNVPVGWGWAIPTKLNGKRTFISFYFVDRNLRGEKIGYDLYRSIRKFVTSKHRRLLLDYQARAIKAKKCNTHTTLIMNQLNVELRAW